MRISGVSALALFVIEVMEKSKVTEILQVELSKHSSFKNWHGLTKENINKFVVEPTAVTVNPDDLETLKRKM